MSLDVIQQVNTLCLATQHRWRQRIADLIESSICIHICGDDSTIRQTIKNNESTLEMFEQYHPWGKTSCRNCRANDARGGAFLRCSTVKRAAPKVTVGCVSDSKENDIISAD